MKESNEVACFKKQAVEERVPQIEERLAVLEGKIESIFSDVEKMQRSIKDILEWAEAVYEFETNRREKLRMVALGSKNNEAAGHSL